MHSRKGRGAGIILSLDNGIGVVMEGVEIDLDPKRVEGLSFISHAHSDHTPRSYKGEVISTKATKKLLRNYSEEKTVANLTVKSNWMILKFGCWSQGTYSALPR